MPETRLEIHPDVKDHDLVEITSYIASDNPVAADDVYDAITELFVELARHPLLGTEYPNYLIYYRPLPEEAGVRILYVLHAARDAAHYAREYLRQ